MTQIYVLDSSALQILNEIAAQDVSLTDKLTYLRDNSHVIYCEAAKNERQNYAKGEPVTIWASSGWRGLKSSAEIRFQNIQSICLEFAKAPHQQNILDINDEDMDQQQAIGTIALAKQLASHSAVTVVSNEKVTLEDRCTVSEACAFLAIPYCTVEEFLKNVAIIIHHQFP